MEDSKIMIAIVLILFFVMMNKKSCGCMENFSNKCKKCEKKDISERQCCEAKCRKLPKQIIDHACEKF